MRLHAPLFLAAALSTSVQAALRQYTLIVTHGTFSGDGVSRSAWLVNGECAAKVVLDVGFVSDKGYLGTTPGPTIIADEGDQVSINVVNNGDEPITIQ
jgi:FtsP/CotA-like multicopper oxidase with cupredoxin domain